MSNWELILVSGGVSYLLRALPFLIFRKIDLSEGSDLSKFLNYAAYSVMGGIVYSALYGERFYEDWTGHLGSGEALKLLAVSMAFLIAVWSRSIIKTLLICLSGYALLLSTI